MNLTFTNEHLDTMGKPGQYEHVYRLLALEGKKPVGGIDYTVFDDEVHIDWIETREGYRRRGIATAMLEQLRACNPGAPIHWGYTSEEGEALRRARGNPETELPVGRARRYRRPDWADEFEAAGHRIDRDGTIVVYHATTAAKAKRILKEGVLRRPWNAPDSYGVYFSTSPKVTENYGDGTLVKLRVRVEGLHLDDIFPSGRMDFSARTYGGIYRPVQLGEVLLEAR